ncbi:MAG TPA: amidohydrolase family protein [Candidatus Sulfotelmatobacter sp.]|nr:amidohydrolase family protein [Candidatus Sulfotelmatobacter sp.]
MSAAIILAADYVLTGPDPELLLPDQAVLIEEGRIVAVDLLTELLQRAPAAEVERLEDCLLMPGFVNAHQHGRALDTLQLGYPDDVLESWIAARRRRGPLDPYPLALLAACNMLANGVTTAIHANTSYGSGNYEGELRAALRGYDEAGLRVVMCVGAQDRGMTIYPEEDLPAFMAGLSPELAQALDAPRPHPYAGDLAATIRLMDRLRADYEGHPRISFCYGPAGPQWVSDEMLAGLARDADKKGIGIHMHALESRAQSAACARLFPGGTMRHLDRLGALSPRVSLAHGVWLSPTDIELAAERGATVVRNPASNLRLRNGVAPLGDFLRQGLRVAIGTDNTGLRGTEDLLGELQLAAALARSNRWDVEDRPTTADLIGMLTVNGAIAAQLDFLIGQIEVGARADLVALSLSRVQQPYADPGLPLLDLVLARASGEDVRLTMVDGTIQYRDGALQTVDRAEVEARVRATAAASREPSDPALAELLPELQAQLRRHYAGLTRAAG